VTAGLPVFRAVARLVHTLVGRVPLAIGTGYEDYAPKTRVLRTVKDTLRLLQRRQLGTMS
jgi:hypothetical protein